VKWPYTRRQKQGSTEAGSVGKEEHGLFFLIITVYHTKWVNVKYILSYVEINSK